MSENDDYKQHQTGQAGNVSHDPQNITPAENGLPGASTNGIPVMKYASTNWTEAVPGIWVGETLSDEEYERIKHEFEVRYGASADAT